MIRLLTLVQKSPGIAPNQRFRHEQWAPHLLRDHNIDLVFDAFESPQLTKSIYTRGKRLHKFRLVLSDSIRRWNRRARAGDFDAVVILREAMLVGGALLERSLRRRGIPVIYDFDDVIWKWDRRGANGLMTLARMPWKVGPICRLASAVTVGNEFLAEFARRYNNDVSIIRTSIDIDRYPPFPEPADGTFTVVWTGSHSTLAHLETIRDALEEMGRIVPTRLRVVCDTAPKPFANLKVDFVPWSASREAVDLAAGHVGIMPLPDSLLARGKCGCKALQYMAIGRPAVVTPLGINREIVRDGVNGLWASSPAEWIQQLKRLAFDPELRLRLGAQARRTVVEEGFTAEASAARFATVVHRVLSERGSRNLPQVISS